HSNATAAPEEASATATSPENGKVNSFVSPIRAVANPMKNSTPDKKSTVDATEVAPPAQAHQRSPMKKVAATDEQEPITLKTPHRLQYGARLQSWQPRDSFDPEIFN